MLRERGAAHRLDLGLMDPQHEPCFAVHHDHAGSMSGRRSLAVKQGWRVA